MDIETYMREAARFDNHIEELTRASLTHGLVAEAGEVAEAIDLGHFGDTLLHELGDVAWNVIRLADDTGTGRRWLTEHVVVPPPPHGKADRALLLSCARFAGLMEKWGRNRTAYWPTEVEVATALGEVWQTLKHCAAIYSFDMDVVMQANIDKLTRRYRERGLPVKEAS